MVHTVVCAVLDDTVISRVWLGTARLDTSTWPFTFHLTDGSLQIREGERQKDDGLYHTTTGVYDVMPETAGKASCWDVMATPAPDAESPIATRVKLGSA